MYTCVSELVTDDVVVSCVFVWGVNKLQMGSLNQGLQVIAVVHWGGWGVNQGYVCVCMCVYACCTVYVCDLCVCVYACCTVYVCVYMCVYVCVNARVTRMYVLTYLSAVVVIVDPLKVAFTLCVIVTVRETSETQSSCITQ